MLLHKRRKKLCKVLAIIYEVNDCETIQNDKQNRNLMVLKKLGLGSDSETLILKPSYSGLVAQWLS